MRSLTLRPLPPKLVMFIERCARERKTSPTRAAIALLEEAAGMLPRPTRKKVHHDLDFLFGTATREEADALDQAIVEQRKIDCEMWK